MRITTSALLSACALLLLLTAPAFAVTRSANPSNYQTVMGQMQPGDILDLAGGNYTNGLTVNGINGSTTNETIIRGPSTGTPATFLGSLSASRNTIEIINSSYVAFENLRVDGQDVDSIHAFSAKDSSSNVVHNIRIENCTIVNHGGQGGTAGQQTVGISAKTPTWGWVIRNNHIVGAGTGLYLGNSNGQEPFIGGIIEGNLIEDPLGYCMEIKHQVSRPSHPGIPTTPQRTIIRHNVWIKNNAPSPSGNRPNLLVGDFPPSGNGSQDWYEIYGNVFFNNPNESLLQATGRVIVHDNVFVNCTAPFPYAAIRFQNHSGGFVRDALVYNNTIYACTNGIRFTNGATGSDAVVGNAVFTTAASDAITGTISNQSDNVTGSTASATSVFVNASTTLGSMDFYPQTGQLQGAALNLAPFSSHTDYDLDFNGDSKGTYAFRGAYAGDGTNPGWAIDRARKPIPTGAPGNVPPVASATITGPGAIGNVHTLDGTASNDPDAGPSAMTYTWAQTSGPSVSFSPSGATSTFTPTSVGTYAFQLTVDDGAATDTDTVSIAITDPNLTIDTSAVNWTHNPSTVLPLSANRTLTYNGSGTLTVTVTTNQLWLAATFDNGSGGNTLAPSASGTVTLTVSSVTGLPAGASNATVTITGNDGITHTAVINVQLTIVPSVGGGSGGSGGCSLDADGAVAGELPVSVLALLIVCAVLVWRRAR